MHLVGREPEVAVLAEIVAALQEQTGAVLLIEGPEGAGKTSLLDVCVDLLVGRGIAHGYARCSRFQTANVFGVARQLWAGEGAQSLGDRKTLTALKARAPSPSGRAHAEGPQASRVIETLADRVARRVQAGPLVVVVDDVQWCDAPSLQLLSRLVDEVSRGPLAIVMSARQDAPAAVLELAAHPRARNLTLGPLDPTAVQVLLAEHMGKEVDSDLTRQYLEASGGNPLLLVELVRDAGDGSSPPDDLPVPEAVRRRVRRDLAALRPEAVRLAAAISVLGQDARISKAAQVAGLEGAEAADAADDLIRLGMVDGGEPLEFAAGIVRDAIYEEIASGARGELHAQAASVLERTSAPEDRVAFHLLRSRPQRLARHVDILRRAGTRAAEAGASQDAVALLARALLEEPPPKVRCELLLSLSTEEMLLGLADLSGEHAEQALALADSGEGRTTATCQLAEALFRAGRFDEAARRLVDELERAPSADLRRRLEKRLVDLAPGRPEIFRLVAARFRGRIAEAPHPDEEERRLVARAGMLLGMAGEADAPQSCRCVEIALGAPGDPAERDSLLELGAALWLLVRAERFDVAERYLLSATPLATTGDEAPMLAYRGYIALQSGSVSRAVALAGEAMEMAERFRHGFSLPATAAFLIDALIELDDLDGAQAAADRVSHIRDTAAWTVVLMCSRGRLQLAFGEIEAALQTFLTAGEHKRHVGAPNPAGYHWASGAALALTRLGRTDEARELALEELALAESWGAVGCIARAQVGVSAASSSSEKLERLEAAAALLEGTAQRRQRAQCLVLLGRGLAERGQPAAARTPLREALDLATRAEATATIRAARTALAAVGVRPRSAYLDGPASLTAAQRRVAALARQGFATSQIASTLQLSPRTVENHLAAIYRKLGTNRSGLRDALPDVADF